MTKFHLLFGCAFATLSAPALAAAPDEAPGNAEPRAGQPAPPAQIRLDDNQAPAETATAAGPANEAADAAAGANQGTGTNTGSAQAAPAAPASDDDDVIVVTATRVETNLQRTPIAISVASAQAMRDRHVQSLYDFADGAIPSLRVATFEARQTALTIGIRGIVPLDANQPAREQGVGIYIDGVYLGRQHGLNAALFDVERIEVLKGPQGTLFGRNTEGGALNIVSRAPTGEFGGRAVAGFGNYGSYNAELHLNLPEFHNIRVKLDGVIQHQDATVRDPLAGSTGWNYFDRHGFRAEIQWRPSDAFTADFAYDNGYDANTAFYSQLLNYNPNGCVAGPQAAVPACVLPGTNYTTLTGTVRPLPAPVVVEGEDRMRVADIGVPQQPSVDRTHGYTFHLRYEFSDAIEIRSITAWRDVTSHQWDNSGGAHRPPVFVPGCTGNACNFSRYSLADLAQTQFSQEIQLVGSVPHLSYTGGLYYFTETAEDDAATPNSNAWNSTGTAYTILDPCIGSAGFGSQIGCRSIDRASIAFSHSYAAYGQATWSPGDERLHITLGGRFTHDDKSGRLFTVNNIPRPYTYEQHTSRFNPLAIVAYDITPTINAYARYSSGYRAGGASSRSITYRSFGPEDVDAYEVGLKTQFFDHRVRFNVAGYVMNRTGSQIDFSAVSFDAITGSNRNTIETINAPGTTKIRGFEADLTVNPVENLTIGLSYAYTYTRIPPVVNPFTGVTQQAYIVFTPRNAASGFIDYSIPIGWATIRAHVDGNYAQATQTFDQYATRNDPSFLVNGRLALADIEVGGGNNSLTIAIWGRNIFNEAHVYRRDPSNSLPGFSTSATGGVGNVLGDYGNFNAPRTFGVEAIISF